MRWALEIRRLSELKDYHKNPRQLSKDQYEHLKKSIDKFGLIDKPIVTKDNILIGGHQRVKVLKKDNVKEIECWIAQEELTPKDIEELNIRLNKNTGDWDYDILANQWEAKDLLDWGFTAEELQFDIEEIGSNDEEDNQLLEPTKEPKTILGDLYQLGEHRLICGDSTIPETVKKLLNGAEPILMVTDPPYGVEYDANKQYKGKAKSVGKVLNDDKVNWALSYILFVGSVSYIWHSSKYAFEVFKSLFDSGFNVSQEIIWKKQSFTLGGSDYQWQHEPCCYAIKKGHNHNWQGSRKESTIWEISNLNAFGTNKEDERTSHSTQKPLECMRRPIINNTAKGEGVYDPFAGSGTTLIACEQLERKSYNIELDPAYCDLIVDRWVKYRKKQNLDCKVILNGNPTEWQMDDKA